MMNCRGLALMAPWRPMVVDGDRALAVGREDDDAAVVGVDDLVEVVAAEVDFLDWLAGVLHSK